MIGYYSKFKIKTTASGYINAGTEQKSVNKDGGASSHPQDSIS